LRALRLPLGAGIGKPPSQDEEENDEVDDREGTATDGEIHKHGEAGLELKEGTNVGVMAGGVFFKLGDADLEANQPGAGFTVIGLHNSSFRVKRCGRVVLPKTTRNNPVKLDERPV